MRIEPAMSDDLGSVRELLHEGNLPYTDLNAQNISNFLIAHDEQDRVVAAVCLDVYSDNALLKSLVVVPDHRSTGLGELMLAAAERRAMDLGLKNIFLLSNIGDAYFAQRGYIAIDPKEAPPAIAATPEFRSYRPDSEVSMVRDLTA